MSDEQQKPPDMNDPKVRTQIFKMTAVRQVVSELLAEHRDEIIKRARAKLVAMGIEFNDEDLGA